MSLRRKCSPAQVLTNLPLVLVEIRKAYRSRCKYLRRKASMVTLARVEKAISTIPQDSSQQQGVNILVSDDYDECCGYVQIVDKLLEDVALFLAEGRSEAAQFLCGQAALDNLQSAIERLESGDTSITAIAYVREDFKTLSVLLRQPAGAPSERKGANG